MPSDEPSDLSPEWVAQLADLPQPAPPPHLDEAVLRAQRRSRQWIRLWRAALPATLAAAALLALLWGATSTPTVALAIGDNVVQGRAQVVAGRVQIGVDGLARITMEPDPQLVRVPLAQSQEDPMKAAMNVLAGAVGGAVVTVAVLEGTATLRTQGEEPIELTAGEVRQIPTTAAVARTPLTPLPGEDQAQTIDRLQGEVQSLRNALGEAQFTGAVTSGQLVAHVGTPQPWPDDVPDGFRPEAVEAKAIQAAASMDNVELVEVDCAEFPCIVIYESADIEDGWAERAKPAAEALAEGLEDAGLSVSAAGFNHDGRKAGFLGVVIAPGDDIGNGSDVDVRTGYRTSTLLEELGTDATTEDSDVTVGGAP